MADPFDNDGSVSDGKLVAKGVRGDNAEPVSVSEISARLKRVVEGEFGFVRLRGELSGAKRAASGHVYLALKDEKAVIDGVMWRGTAQRLAFAPEDGLEVVASGKLTTYPGRSKYQIVIERMEIAGEGALLALLEKNRQRFQAEGLFAEDRKRAIPFLPRRIGVVTSPTGAVIRDILHRLADRFPTHVMLWPVIVQGQGAADQVAAAIRSFDAMAKDGAPAQPDLLIVGRGGGSIEDLWAFNEEAVVRAIADCSIPVISAVGHETDTTLADFAADRRAPTPTAAAEMAVPVRAELALQIEDLSLRQRRFAMRPVELGRERLDARWQRLPRTDALTQQATQKLDDLAERLKRGLADRAARAREPLLGWQGRLQPALIRRAIADRKGALDRSRIEPQLIRRSVRSLQDRQAALGRVLASLSPYGPLQRGYALVTGPDGKARTSAAVARAEATLSLRFADGTIAVSTGASPGEARSRNPLPAPSPAPRKRARRKTPPADQPKLL